MTGAPPWWHDAVIYQVYVRSFADATGDGIGDLAGLRQRLDHLNDGTPRSLGVTALWLSPCYPSPQVDFGYDVSDYTSVDPVYGDLAELDALVADLHARGIRLLVDLVMNHTSAAHPWFVQSRADRTNPRRDWYIWADPAPGGGPPNNWLSAFERCGPSWTLDERTGQYYLHSFTPAQPDLNWRNPAVWAAMREVWRFWLDRGVDGFRVDVAHRMMKDPLLRDNPPEVAHARRFYAHPTHRQRQLDLPEVHDVLRDLRRTLDSYGDGAGERIALGEVPIDDDERLARYLRPDELHTAFHVALWDQPWDAAAMRSTVDRLAGLLPPPARPVYALATHDITRTVSRYGGGEVGRRRARVAAMLMFTLPGVPCVYYGEEIGMADAPPPAALTSDVDGRDAVRTPMQWDATGEGFSSGVPWLPVPPDAASVNVADQDGDPGSLLALYRRLAWHRHGCAALRGGVYRSLDASAGVFAYLRDRVLVALNFTDRAAQLTLAGQPQHGLVAVSTRPERDGAQVGLAPLRLAPDEGVIIRFTGKEAVHGEEGE
ncbi:MAG TPA: alpha-amylase family glycosyl hydrolase [Micromonosporaceae bacterium]|nr:alpha-amylase family glycosyl hydrolase [Micromonosporaceae bacterium]